MSNAENTPLSQLSQDSIDLIDNFANQMKEKLLSAQEKYGYIDDWLDPNWQVECNSLLNKHIEKGDPVDVAIYCAFMAFHNWSTEEHIPRLKAHAKVGALIFRKGVKQNLVIEAAQRRYNYEHPIDINKTKTDFQKVIEIRSEILKKHGDKKPDADIRGEIKCPSCISGIIDYSVSSYNGHTSGQCRTHGCIYWME